jgi:stearoyl-CoA desaturase (Delta-9 desaturase)
VGVTFRCNHGVTFGATTMWAPLLDSVLPMLRTILLGVVTGLAVTQLANFATTVYLHRGLAHRALTVRPWLGFAFRVVIWLTTGMRPRQWVAVHRKHHAFTDQTDDPHSPARLGWVRVQLTNPGLYRRVARDEDQVLRYSRDLPPTRVDRLLFDRALLGLGLGIALLVVTIGWQAALIAAPLHMAAYLGLSGAVNAVAHTFGRRPFATSATNVQWLAFLTAGEGLHNNHHAAPTSARFSLGRFEFDPSWRVIKVLSRLGWVRVRHEHPKFVVPRSAASGS